MLDVLEKLSRSSLVFKGGSSLLLCHGGTRFSEDLDFDAFAPRNLKSVLGSLASKYQALGCTYEVDNPKNTSTSSRYNIFVSGEYGSFKLKLDISLRAFRKGSDQPPLETINGIETYSIQEIFNQKVNAVVGTETSNQRTKSRDIYDLNFILAKPNIVVDQHQLIRLKNELGNPDSMFERYLEAWEEDPITSDFSLDEASINLFDSVESRIANSGHDRRGLFAKAVENIESGNDRDPKINESDPEP